MIYVDENHKGNCLIKHIKKDNFKEDLMSLIETNQHMNMTFFYMNIYLQMKILKKRPSPGI